MSPEAEARYRFCVAPRFAHRCAWAERLERNGGVELEGGRTFPRDDWKGLDEASLEELVDEVPGRDAVLPPTHLGLLRLPERLRLAFWAQAERSGGDAGDRGFERLFTELVDFLRFKRLPLAERVNLEVAASAPGLPSTRIGADGALAGLGFGDRPGSEEAPARRPLGLVSLGDETAFVVLLPLPPGTLASRLESTGEADARALARRDLPRRYFARFPQQPLLRVRLAPGEGLWLPPGGVVHDGWTHGKRDLDLMLRVLPDAGVVPVP